jgi:hypothetical protein
MKDTIALAKERGVEVGTKFFKILDLDSKEIPLLNTYACAYPELGFSKTKVNVPEFSLNSCWRVTVKKLVKEYAKPSLQ